MTWQVELRQEAYWWRRQVVGVEQPVDLLGGHRSTYVNLDNAGTTPMLHSVREALRQAEETYGSPHPSAGYRARRSLELYEQARAEVLRFVGAWDGTRVALFTKSATEAVNKLAAEFPFAVGDVVVLSEMEHHANLLPWRGRAKIVYLPVDVEGRLEVDALPKLLERHRGHVRLVALAGASNVTGYVSDVYLAAEIAHRYGARIFVDAAQLAGHRTIDMGDAGDPRSIDFLSLSGYKLYAPYGIGALIGPKEFFRGGAPDLKGGGAIRFVSLEDVLWNDPPAREEAGSQNVFGAVALAAALRTLQAIGMDRVAAREEQLLAYALDRIEEVPGVEVLGSASREERLGVVAFQIHGVPARLVAAALGWEWGIGARAGCFCASPYVMRLLGLSRQEVERLRDRMLDGALDELPAAVRVSLGLYNVEQEIDRLHEAIRAIRLGEFKGRYALQPATGEYLLDATDDIGRTL